jgi:ribonuclease P protein component
MNQRATKQRPLRFPKERRLQRSRDFERVRTNGRTIRGGALMLGILEVSEEPMFKIGFVTSKRIGGAVARNRVRRRLREIVRRAQPRLRNGFWLVLVARPSAAQADYAALEKEWGRLVTRAALTE